jgi:hypothetical protein
MFAADLHLIQAARQLSRDDSLDAAHILPTHLLCRLP